LTAAELKTFNKDNSYGLDHALWASDPGNHRNISLQNILQQDVIAPDGSESRVRPSPDGLRPVLATGTCRYPVAGLTDPRVKELWWAVERGYPGALKALKDAASRKGPAQAELTTVLDAVKAATAKRQDELVAAPATMETYEALEAFAAESDGLDTKAALARLKELKAAKELKDEFKARDIWQQCQAALASPKPDAQKSAKANLAALAAKMPDTVYGKKAAALK
jgi:hypothetical protein